MSPRENLPEDPPAAKHAADAEAPMTPEQVQHLKALGRRAGDPDAFDETLTQAAAQKRIVALETLLDREERSGVERFPRT